VSSEEELLKRRLMLELQRKMLVKQIKRDVEKPDYTSVFLKHLSDDGKEMFKLAMDQYPDVAQKVAETLGKLYHDGRLEGILDAEAVYGIFEEIGYPIRIETKIVYKKKGEVKSISDLLKEKKE
jgi:DNA-binding TFAR19-related protein (PDSD5 family)